MTFLARPSTALVFGVFFMCAATCAGFDEITTSPLSLVPDWAAGALLVGGAVISARDWTNGRTYQIASWAFMVSLLFGSAVGNFELWTSRTADGGYGLVAMSQGTYLAIVSVLFLIALAGLIASLRVRREDRKS